ncbi:MAG: GNAT family N-acetyltransferase [Euryarchaeota archaeon]|nr:GNAT family N-acetyltransferase [Euryarchaeota archaeon]
MNVTAARDEHIPQIVELWKDLMDLHKKFDPFFSRRADGDIRFTEFVKKSISSMDEHVVVAIEEGRMVGYCLGSIATHPPVFLVEKYGYIFDMMVDPLYRRQHVGTELVNAMILWFSSHGIQRFELNVAVKNKHGKRFWKKQGFREYMRVMYLEKS